MSDSWESFIGALQEECVAFRELNARALALSDALVNPDADAIVVAQQSLEVARQSHAAALAKRRGMQQRGFTGLTLREVCGYAPAHLMREITQRTSELTYYATSLEIVNSNNKALLVGGMERLMNVMTILQRSQTQTPLTYKRRGVVPPVDASVIMSKKA